MAALWAAATEKGRLDGLEVDPVNEEVRWGSIYWAKVARIDASLDAAFVNLDGDNIGLLHCADADQTKDGTYKKGGDAGDRQIDPAGRDDCRAGQGRLSAARR